MGLKAHVKLQSHQRRGRSTVKRARLRARLRRAGVRRLLGCGERVARNGRRRGEFRQRGGHGRQRRKPRRRLLESISAIFNPTTATSASPTATSSGALARQGKRLTRSRPSSPEETASKDPGNPYDPCSAELAGMLGAAPRIGDASEDSGRLYDPSCCRGPLCIEGGSPYDPSSEAYVSDDRLRRIMATAVTASPAASPASTATASLACWATVCCGKLYMLGSCDNCSCYRGLPKPPDRDWRQARPCPWRKSWGGRSASPWRPSFMGGRPAPP